MSIRFGPACAECSRVLTSKARKTARLGAVREAARDRRGQGSPRPPPSLFQFIGAPNRKNHATVADDVKGCLSGAGRTHLYRRPNATATIVPSSRVVIATVFQYPSHPGWEIRASLPRKLASYPWVRSQSRARDHPQLLGRRHVILKVDSELHACARICSSHRSFLGVCPYRRMSLTCRTISARARGDDGCPRRVRRRRRSQTRPAAEPTARGCAISFVVVMVNAPMEHPEAG
jgi:hypothetical protein